MCCWSGTDTWLIHGAIGQIKKQCAVCETTGSIAPLNPWTIIWMLQRTQNDLFHPSQQRGKLGPNLLMLTNPGSWIEGLFWLIPSFQLLCWGCLCAAKRTQVAQTFIPGQRRWCRWYGMWGLSKGCYCFWEAKRRACVCVHESSKQTNG